MFSMKRLAISIYRGCEDCQGENGGPRERFFVGLDNLDKISLGG